MTFIAPGIEVEPDEKTEEQDEYEDQLEQVQTCLSSKEKRRQYSQTRRAKTISEENSIETSFDHGKANDQPNRLHRSNVFALDGQPRRHTCTHAMYRDKTNFDYKYGPKIHKQYSLQ